MNSFGDIVSSIPPWVFVVLALLVGLGVRALWSRPAKLPLLLIAPLAFVGWGVLSLKADLAQHAGLFAALGAGTLLGAIIAAVTAHIDPKIEHRGDEIMIAGSALPLVRNLLIFAAKFTVTFAAMADPARREPLLIWNVGLFGLTIGYFGVWTALLLARYQRRQVAAIKPS
jgi:hypothetical protein